LVVTVSTRAAAGRRDDTAGPALAEGLAGLGFAVTGPVVVADGEPAGAAIARGVRDGFALVVTTGGTGVSPTDRTPEQTRPLLDLELPGLAEAIRARGVAGGAPMAVISRGLAGVAGGSIVVNLPGSPKAIPDGLAVLSPLVHHLIDQVRGGDHPGGPA
jgi:molybdenum cofactor synthesis domain-containing protein